MREINWTALITSLIVVCAVAVVGSLFTSSSVESEWYESIKPSITPPNWVFPVVWSILFFLIALSLYIVWTSANKENKGKIFLAYGINFVFNIMWSVSYFGLKDPLAAFIDLIFLFLSVLYILVFSWKIDRRASYLLIPYLLWVGFAGILNYLSISSL